MTRWVGKLEHVIAKQVSAIKTSGAGKRAAGRGNTVIRANQRNNQQMPAGGMSLSVCVDVYVCVGDGGRGWSHRTVVSLAFG